jgi:hypothetical protein
MSIDRRQKNHSVKYLSSQRRVKRGRMTMKLDKQQQQQTMNTNFFKDFNTKNNDKITTSKRIHYAFTFIYVITSAFIIISGVIWFDRITLQRSDLLGFFHFVTAYLIAILVLGNEFKSNKKFPYRRFTVTKNASWLVIAFSFFSIVFAVLYIMTIASVLIFVCPNVNTTTVNTLNPPLPITTTETTVKEVEEEGEDFKNVIDVKPEPFSTKKSEIIQVNEEWMCTNEFGFMIGVIVFVSLFITLNIITIYFYARIIL